MERNMAGTTGVSNAPTYLVWSIFNTLCCCFPLGIIAIVFSRRTHTANTIGDSTRAKAHSSTAKKLNIAALVIGMVFFIISIVLCVTVLAKQT
ncbi:interferon induced protein 2 [Ictalurus punctatus]|uniref:Interferon induced protein 2 n=1 Tax=Ictalurus punctatus TaxID=7998 RepID=Q8JH61_ICTPU|nr:interferon induced protein 2 [Ictalurus punctatus]AAN04880.1 interferon induced protein 2 [Ictalurus punctatus]